MKNRNIWLGLLFVLAGLVIGGLLGQIAENVSSLTWLNYGKEFGISTPFTLDLNIIKLTFGLMIKINIASVVGIIISMLIYRKLVK